MWANLLLYAILLLLAYYSIGSRNFLKKAGFRKTRLKEDTLFALGLLLLMLVTSFTITLFFHAIGMAEDAEKVKEAAQATPVEQLLTILVIAPVVEEIFFRGYLQKRTNLLVASAAFSYFHIVYGSLSELVGAFVLGALLGIAFNKSKNLYVPTLAHYLYNFIVVGLSLAPS